MRRNRLLGGILGTLAALAASVALAQLYSQNFDVNDTANWKVNNNGNGTNAANFFFDYSTVGIPSAPNSAGGTTRGLKLGANLGAAPAAGANPGISVSPLGKSFVGNYELKFDWWSNYLGPVGGSPASATQVSTFGILTSGNTANFVGGADGLFFGASAQGGVAAADADDGDYGAYSVERPIGYQRPLDDPIDAHALYLANNSRDHLAALYSTVFPGGVMAPALQRTNFASTQTGTTPAGTPGFAWHQVEIEKLGSNVIWRVDGVPLIYVDISAFSGSVGGGNILFGHSDIDLLASTNANFATLDFTLIDNVRVVSLAGDYNLSGDVDAADYTVWKQNYRATGANAADGNGDGIVNAADYTVWRNTLTAGSGAGGIDGELLPVPEPQFAAILLPAVAMLLVAARRIRSGTS